jgi:hypothetical protein
MPMITVRLPWLGWTRVFSQAKRPSFGSVWSSLSKMATVTPPSVSKVFAGVPSSSLVR